MFETIGNLLTFAFWAVAIILFGGGIFYCIATLIKGSGWEKFWCILALGLGAFAFFRIYDWLDSILWSLLLSGVALISIGTATSKWAPERKPKPGPTFGEVFVDTYCEYELQKKATKDAIRELEEGR